MTENHLWFAASFALVLASCWGAYWLGRLRGTGDAHTKAYNDGFALGRALGRSEGRQDR
jgi:hypothetical protein